MAPETLVVALPVLAEQAEPESDPEGPDESLVHIDFEGLAERVRRISISGSRETAPFWSHDNKTLAFTSTIDGRKGTYKVGIPDAVLCKPGALTEEEREIMADSGKVMGYATKILIESPREDLFSGEISVELDSSRFRLNTVKPLALLNGFMVKSNTVGNTVMAAFAGTEPVMGEGEVMEVEIIPVSDDVSESDLEDIIISFARLNEYKQAAVNIKRERYSAPVKAAVAVNSLRSVYPNPFVNRLSVEYSVAELVIISGESNEEDRDRLIAAYAGDNGAVISSQGAGKAHVAKAVELFGGPENNRE